MSQHEEQVKRIFLDALEIESLEARQIFVQEQCGEDAILRDDVEQLLRQQDRMKSFLEPKPISDPGSVETVDCNSQNVETDGIPIARPRRPRKDSINEKPGSMIGRYKLLQQIGEGGFGVVYMAEQLEPVKRRVALKVIKAGMDTNAVIARFEAERQALAMMDHSNIARVFDAGATDTGRPYFVMELVKGIPITQYCDEVNLDTRHRLDLFKDVCSAVQHAHQKGIIHRDLKPSNIMVTQHDDKPVVKVIDFGIAKATQQKLTEKTLFTNYGQMIGTPTYMSPEQAVMNELDVDTRSDVYSLGVLLYEMLTGSLPFDAKTLRTAGYDEMRRIIREQEPPKPSTRLSTLAADVKLTIASKRHVSPAALNKQLQGDLDWIVMKALEKDRARRYESASAFAQDIERHINAEPVNAAAPTAGYRLRKFVRRNKGPMAVAATIALLLIAGTVLSTLLAVRATRAERLAEQRLVEVEREKTNAQAAAAKEKSANEQAQKRLGQLEKGNEIITSIFTDLNINELKEGTEPLEAVLAKRLIKAADQLVDESVGDPVTVAQLQSRLGLSLLSLGYAEDAIKLFAQARATFTAQQGDDHPNTLTVISNLVLAYYRAGKLDLALPLAEQEFKLSKAKLGDEHPSTLISMNNLAMAYMATGQPDRALPLYEQTLKLSKAKLGDGHPDTLISMNNLAVAYKDAGKLDLALLLCEETLKLSKAKRGDDHPQTLTAMNNLALAYADAGKLDLALPLQEQTLKLLKAKLGDEHPDTLTTMNNLAIAYEHAGKPELALPLYEQTLNLRKAKLGDDHPDTLDSMNTLALAYLEAGKLDLALPLCEETLKLSKAKRGDGHPDTLISMNTLALAYLEAGKLDLALPLFEETLKLSKAKLGDDHPHTLNAMDNLAMAYADAGKLDLALPLHEQTLKLQKAKLGDEHPDTLTTMNNLAIAYEDAGKPELALPLYEQTLNLRKAKLGDDHPDTLISMNNLATAYWSTGKLDKSVPLFEKLVQIGEAKLGRGHPEILDYIGNLGVNYKDSGQVERALPLLEEVYEASKKYPGLKWVGTDLMEAYIKTGRVTDAGKASGILAEIRKTLPPGSPQLAGTLAFTALQMLEAKAYKQAEPILRECVAIREKLMPDHWLLFNTKSMLGGALLGQRKYAEAEPLLVEGYQGMKQREADIPAEGKIRLTESLERLVTLYAERNAEGDAAKAGKYRKLLEARQQEAQGQPKP